MDVAVAAGGAAWEHAAIGEIESSGALRLTRRCVDVADLLAVAPTGRMGAALVSVDLPGLDVDAVAELGRAGVVVAAVEADPSCCEALGISRIARLGHLDDILRDAPIRPAQTGARRAPLIAVWGPAGAPGRSTVALAMASSAAARGLDTALVDADTYGGALGQMLGVLDDVSGVVAACRAANQGRGAEIADHLLGIDPSLRLLTGIPRADMWPQVRTTAFEMVLDRLRSEAALVVVDVGAPIEPAAGPGPGRNQTTLQTLAAADVIVVVGRPDPVGLARLVRGLNDLNVVAPGVPQLVAINLMRPSLVWRERDVRATVSRLTGLEPVAHLPFDQAGVDLATVSGRTPRESSPSSPFVARVETLTTQALAASSGALSGSGS